MSGAQAQRRARATGRLGETPAEAQHRLRKFEITQRVATLKSRVAATDPRHAKARAVLVDGLRSAEADLVRLEGGADVVALAADPAAVRAARDEARRRLHLLLVVTATVPDSCRMAAQTLRRGIERELRQLELLRKDQRHETF